MTEKTRYSAVVLDEESHTLAIKIAKMVGNGIILQAGWEQIAHHVTLNLGPLKENMKHLLGKEYSVIVSEIGYSHKAVALKVIGKVAELSSNEVPHITVAVNREANGKPVDSNKIKNWNRLPANYVLCGVVTEVK